MVSSTEATEITAETELIVSCEVVEAPRFTKFITDIKVKQGWPATFEVIALGKPSPDISWLRDNFAISPSPEYQVCLVTYNTTILYLAV